MRTIEKYKNVSDEELSLLFQENKNAIFFKELFTRWEKRALSFCTFNLNISDIEIAKDLVQEAFIKAFTSMEKKGYNSNSGKFSTWFFVILKNHTIDFLRKNSIKQKFVRIDELVGENHDIHREIVDSEDDPEESIIHLEEIHQYRINEVLSHLPESLRDIVILRYFQEFSYEEISIFIDVPLGTVKEKLHRATQMLRELLETEKKPNKDQ